MTTISAQAILVSRNVADPNQNRKLVTVLCRYPRFIHAELMTHRVFSRNAASSRAIPVEKMIRSIIEDTAMPLHWGANQPGMQADEECNARVNIVGCASKTREEAWLHARDHAIFVAQAFGKAHYHKQVVNRLLEPFMHITTLISSTEWENFFALRIHKDAEPHIRMLAERIKEAIDTAKTEYLDPGEWHLPFVCYGDYCENANITQKEALQLSVARCASTSYKTTDGFDMTLEKAEQIFAKLASNPLHASPFEHVAQADAYYSLPNFNGWGGSEQHRNFVGFRQYRAMVEKEIA